MRFLSGQLLFIPLLTAGLFHPALGRGDPVKIVSSLPDYASIAELVGGNRVRTSSIARGYQDAHFVKAKPSFAREMAEADLFLTTGLDLELWVPTLIDRSRNAAIREGGPGYVSISEGMSFLDAPLAADRSLGDIHIYGNPHVHTDPLRGIVIARNILAGLKRVDEENSAEYQRNFEKFKNDTYTRLYGRELTGLIGGDRLSQLSQTGGLDSFLDSNQFSGRKLRDLLGGWMKQAECLRGKPIIAYHKNWAYLADRFGLEIVDYVEHRPGIPASARHVSDLIEKIERLQIKALLTANYFDEKTPRMIEEKTGAKALIVPLSVGGVPEAATYFDLFDIWLSALRSVFPDCD